ncbi:MAG: serine hydrolase [Cyclobacteriaceae bacterium]|nr:serine hydrolase [Cyclobacteriaceae bacterium]
MLRLIYLKSCSALLVLAVTLSSCSSDEPTPSPLLYFPPNGSSTWEQTNPASLGWNTTKIAELDAFMTSTNTRALLVLKDGKMVIEKYAGKQLVNINQDFTATSNWYWASAGKTLTAALAGIAVAQGELNLDEKTSTYLGTGWTSLTTAQENKITVRHQLTMTTGLDDGVANRDCTLPECLTYKAEPGTRWAYHNAPYTLLDGVLTNATGKTLNNFLNEVMKSSTGMDGQYIQTGDNNVYYSTPRSMARLGLLLLSKGKWAQTQVIPEAYATLMTTSSQTMNPAYGYLTWLNGKASYIPPAPLQISIPGYITPDAPADMYAAMGKNGQLINVVPSQNLVVIRMGDDPDTSLVPYLFQNDLWIKLNEIINP